jgi:hypothetical protein
MKKFVAVAVAVAGVAWAVLRGRGSGQNTWAETTDRV